MFGCGHRVKIARHSSNRPSTTWPTWSKRIFALRINVIMICRDARWRRSRIWHAANCWPPPGVGPRPTGTFLCIARPARPHLPGRPSAADVSSGRVVQELRPRRGGAAAWGHGREPRDRQRHPGRGHVARPRPAGCRSAGRTRLPLTGPIRKSPSRNGGIEDRECSARLIGGCASTLRRWWPIR